MKRSFTLPTSPRRPVRLAAVSAAIAALVGGLGTDTFAKSGGAVGDQVVIQFLASTSQDVDGTARARWKDKGEGELEFNVELEHMDAGTYDLYVTDLVTPKGSITVDGTGEGEIEFAIPQDGVKPLFDFTVLGEQVEVRQGDTAFFSDLFAASGGAGGGGSGDKTKTQVNFVNVNAASDFNAQGSLKYEASKTTRKFSIEVEKLDAGTYTILVGGVPVGELTTLNSDSVEVEFQDPVEPGKTLLNFDPLGQQIDIAAGGIVALTGTLAGANSDTGTKPPSNGKKAAKDLGKAKADSLLVFLLNSGTLAGAEGSVTLTQSDHAELLVKLLSVTGGDYGLFVDGALVGTLMADSTGTAQLEFSTTPGAGQLLLDFAVKAELIQVKSGADVILSVVFPNSVQSALGSFKKEISKSFNVKVNLINAGSDLDATGLVEWTKQTNGNQEVRIDVRDLAAGNYKIVVNGVTSASQLNVPAKPASGKGKLTWATVTKGSQVLLDFDPVDANVQVTDAGDVVMLQAVIDVP